MEHFDECSPHTAELLEDPRLASIASIPGDGHKMGEAGTNRIEALFKPIGVTRGISDVPGTRTARSAGTATTAAASPPASR